MIRPLVPGRQFALHLRRVAGSILGIVGLAVLSFGLLILSACDGTGGGNNGGGGGGGAKPLPPTLGLPGLNTEKTAPPLPGNGLTFTWKPPEGGADQYSLYIFKSPYGDQNKVYTRDEIRGTDTSFASGFCPAPDPGAIFCWTMVSHRKGRLVSEQAVPLYFRVTNATVDVFPGSVVTSGTVTQKCGNTLPRSDIKPIPTPAGADIIIHPGVDIALPKALREKVKPGTTPIHPIADGVVVRRYWGKKDIGNAEEGKGADDSTVGNAVMVKNNDGTYALYCHMYDAASMPTTGTKVYAGSSTLGMIGNTGVGTGPHLHLEIRRFGPSEKPASSGEWASWYPPVALHWGVWNCDRTTGQYILEDGKKKIEPNIYGDTKECREVFTQNWIDPGTMATVVEKSASPAPSPEATALTGASDPKSGSFQDTVSVEPTASATRVPTPPPPAFPSRSDRTVRPPVRR